MCVVHLPCGLLFLDSFRVLDFLCKEWHVLSHRCQVLEVLGFKLGVFVHVVLGQLFLDFLLFVIHESIQLLNVELALSEVEI